MRNIAPTNHQLKYSRFKGATGKAMGLTLGATLLISSWSIPVLYGNNSHSGPKIAPPNKTGYAQKFKILWTALLQQVLASLPLIPK